MDLHKRIHRSIGPTSYIQQFLFVTFDFQVFKSRIFGHPIKTDCRFRKWHKRSVFRKKNGDLSVVATCGVDQKHSMYHLTEKENE